ncbi:hypothetical protein ACLOJK_007665, partial [Asimina triloba]
MGVGRWLAGASDGSWPSAGGSGWLQADGCSRGRRQWRWRTAGRHDGFSRCNLGSSCGG